MVTASARAEQVQLDRARIAPLTSPSSATDTSFLSDYKPNETRTPFLSRVNRGTTVNFLSDAVLGAT